MIGLVNGTVAQVISVSKDKDNEIISVNILLPTGENYSIPRLEYQFIIMDKIYIIRKQFPICNSYGITIHKSQGLSLKTAVVEAGNRIYSCGQTYEALSRVTKLEGLHLINFDPSSVMSDTSAILEYNRLREQYRLDLVLFNIPNDNKKRQIKVQDIQWPMIQNIPMMEGNKTKVNEISDSRWEIFGLPKEDGVSCYANACIQSLLHCMSIRRILLHYSGDEKLSLMSTSQNKKLMLQH